MHGNAVNFFLKFNSPHPKKKKNPLLFLCSIITRLCLMLPSIQIGSIFWGGDITTEMLDVAPVKRDELPTAHQPGPM